MAEGMNWYFASVDSELPPAYDHGNNPLQQRFEKPFIYFLLELQNVAN